MANSEIQRLNVWRNRVGWARKVRSDYLQNYDEYIRYYKGDQLDIFNLSLDELIIVNLFYSHIKATIPMLYFQNPYFYVHAKRPEFKANAEVAEAVLNYYVRRGRTKREFRLATLDAILLLGVIKTGYDPTFRNNPDKGKHIKYGIDDHGQEVYLLDPDTGEIMEEPDELLIKENFFMKRVSPRNMLFDPEPKNFVEDQMWIGEEIIERLDDVKENELYKNRDKVKETHIATKETFYMSGTQQFDEIQEDLKRVRLVKLYDFRDEVFRVYADGAQPDDLEFLYEEDIDKGIKLHPYNILKFNELPDEFYPLSDMTVLKGPQDEFNIGMSVLTSHVKKFIRKYMYETGTFPNDDEMNKLLEPIENLIEVNKGRIKEGIAPVPVPTVEPDLYQYLDRTLKSFWMTAGRTEQERGSVERRKTMFESSQIEKYGQLRNSDKVSLVEDWALDGGEKMLDSLQANLRLPIAVEIAGEEIGKHWEVDLTKERIQGEFDIGIALGSTTPKIPEVEKEQLVQFLEVLSKTPGIEYMIKQPVDKEIDIGEFILQLAKKYDIEEYEIIKPRKGIGGVPGAGGNVINMPQILQALGLRGGGKGGKIPQRRQVPGRQLKRGGR